MSYVCFLHICVHCGHIFWFSTSGGLKMWEGSLDLVKALQSEIQSEHLSFTGKRVIEVRS